MIEEEVYSDSDHSSIYTSEDEFEQDDTLQQRFSIHNPLMAGELMDGSKLASSVNTSVLPANLRSIGGDTKTVQMKITDEDPNMATLDMNSAGSLEQNSGAMSPRFDQPSSPTIPSSPQGILKSNKPPTKKQVEEEKVKKVKQGFAEKVKTRNNELNINSEGLTKEQ